MSEQSKKPIGTHDPTRNNGGETSPGEQMIVKVPHSPPPNDQTPKKTKNPHEWTKTILTGLAVLISLYALSVSMDSRDAAKRSASAAEKSAAAAQENVATAKAALEATIEKDHRDQRAWIAVESLVTHPPVPEVGQTYRMSVNFRNSGKTPAKKIVAATVVDPVLLPAEPNLSYQGQKVVRIGMIPPGGANFASLGPIKTTKDGVKEDAPLTTEILNALKNETVRLYVHGRMTYADIFGNCHWLTFCYYLTAPSLSSFSVCPGHNDTDDEECKNNE